MFTLKITIIIITIKTYANQSIWCIYMGNWVVIYYVGTGMLYEDWGVLWRLAVMCYVGTGCYVMWGLRCYVGIGCYIIYEH
jgi:hypothetical protein